jgi:hypothetical protein
MTTHRALLVVSLSLFAAGVAAAQEATAKAAEVEPFIGTWAFTMAEPNAMKGAHQTIRVWDDGGSAAASLQIGRFPAIRATRVVRDAGMLVVTISHAAQPQILENGAPIWVVVVLTRDGDAMATAEMMERSQTIKRGVGRLEDKFVLSRRHGGLGGPYQLPALHAT